MATSERPKIEHFGARSGDVLEAQIARLRAIFPEVFVEGKIDFDKLRTTLGGAAESGPGRFHFGWAGKDDAVNLLQTPSAGTLMPYPDESIDLETTGNVFIEGDNMAFVWIEELGNSATWRSCARLSFSRGGDRSQHSGKDPAMDGIQRIPVDKTSQARGVENGSLADI